MIPLIDATEFLLFRPERMGQEPDNEEWDNGRQHEPIHEDPSGYLYSSIFCQKPRSPSKTKGKMLF